MISPDLWKTIDLDVFEHIPHTYIPLLREVSHHCIDFKWNYLYTATHTVPDLRKLKNVKILDLSENIQVTNFTFLSCLPKLEHLYLQNCQHIASSELLVCLPHLTNLTHLDLSGCTQLTEDALLEVTPTVEKLEVCMLNDCCTFTCDSIEKLLSSCNNLKRFHFCPEVDWSNPQQWLHLLEARQELEMCPAVLEILDDYADI